MRRKECVHPHPHITYVYTHTEIDQYTHHSRKKNKKTIGNTPHTSAPLVYFSGFSFVLCGSLSVCFLPPPLLLLLLLPPLSLYSTAAANATSPLLLHSQRLTN